MARNRHTAPATTGGAPHKDTEREICALRNKIELIDALVQEATDTIDVLTQGAQAILQSGDDMTVVYRLLGEIRDRAFDITNTVNCEAEEVGANHRSGNGPDELAGEFVGRRWRVQDVGSAAAAGLHSASIAGTREAAQ